MTLVTEANNHGEDCGPAGLQMSLAAEKQANYTVLGIGQDAAEAFAPFRITIDGQRIAIIAATQVIDSDLQTAWTATATQPGLASAYDVADLVQAVEAARKVSDTVIVFLHWGTELDACPNPDQEPLANAAGPGRRRHHRGQPRPRSAGRRLSGLGLRRLRAGQLRLLQRPAAHRPERLPGRHGHRRHIDSVTWRPAVIQDELPQPLTGAAATSAVQSWTAARSAPTPRRHPEPPWPRPSSETSPASPAVTQQLSVDSG